MKNITDILQGVEVLRREGAETAVLDIQFDSRKVHENSLFVATRGTQVDGHNFIDMAVSAGARAVICETLPDVLSSNFCYIQVENSQKALGICASNYYGNPSHKLKLVGITGTNGKTTIVTLLHRLFINLGYKAGLLSTIKNLIHETEISASHTTPDAVQINKLLADMVEAGCDYCFMEVSSHAIHQYRIAGLQFAGGAFTNITHDHLDYHKTFQEYIKAKKAFFDGLPAEAFAVSNADDKNGKIMLQNCKANKFMYSIRSMADYRAKIIESHFDGMLLNLDGNEIWVQLIGKYNASNLIVVYAIAHLLNQKTEEILQHLSTLATVEGRLEAIKENNIYALVDYAHTPDALLNVLNTINDIRTGNETLITVFGAGGNRDSNKRPQMGKIAARESNKVIITSDNPRNEDPNAIIQQISAGVDEADRRKVLHIENREEAIRTACMLANPGDIILVAGKGHENYQEINDTKYPFNDKEKLIENLK
jgi:UDP-N-acetylmuramoyl-L-alanyl-D-glutamate--2,6-diaminopimelate ligase